MAEVLAEYTIRFAILGCASRLDHYLPTHPNPLRRRFFKISMAASPLEESVTG